jgi:hypothetical protein
VVLVVLVVEAAVEIRTNHLELLELQTLVVVVEVELMIFLQELLVAQES